MEKYATMPEMEIIRFETEDVLLNSGGVNSGIEGDGANGGGGLED